MCGIVGFNFRDRELLLRMMKLIEHRGPDQHAGILISNFSLGHQRLSIIDLSEKGRQPMCNEEGDKWVVFNGEIYNFKSIREDLERRGHKFRSNTDTEVIIHAYEEYGYDCVNHFNGMFAFAILDNKRLFIARDHVGIKPIYYYFDKRRFIFASEIKALLEADVNVAVNYNSIDLLLTYRTVPGNETLFCNIKKLLPGHYLIFENNEITSKQYYQPEIYERGSLDEDVLANEFLELFKKSVERMMVADVPVGAFLSGGLDSSCVVGMMRRLKGEVKTFTAGFNEEHDELEYAKKVAEYFNTDHHEVVISYDEMTKSFDDVVYHMDEPIADPAAFPVCFVSKLAREKVKVALFGEGADELFAGYEKYKILNEYFFPLRRYLQTDRLLTSGRKRIYHKGGNVDSVMSNYFHKNWNLNNALLFDFKEILPNFQLMKVDKMTMMHSLEGRVPFLDREIVDFAFGLPLRYKLNNGVGKYIVRKAMKDIIPKEIAFGGKRVFFTPLKKWFDNGLRDVAIERFEKTELFNKRNILKLLNKESNSLRRYKYSNQLWSLLMIESWFGKFIKEDKVVI